MRLNEFLARCLAARKITIALLDMTPDEQNRSFIADKYGMRLPDELWIQAMPEAEFIVGALMAFDLHQTVREYYEAEDGE